MYKQIGAAAIALVLSLGLVSTAFAQQTNATGLQIQIVPEIQRGHNQHLTVFAVDDDGNQVNETITTQVTNERGQQVGPGTVESESGDVLTYKVGPNTRPQNITVYSYLSGADVSASQDYYVFPKGQAQEPAPANDTQPSPELPIPIEPTPNGTIPAENDTAPVEEIPPIITAPANETGGNETGPVIIEQPTNQTEVPTTGNDTEVGTGDNQTSGNTTTTEPEQPAPAPNATQAFDSLANTTALLDEAIEAGGGDADESQRAEIKAAISESARAIGGVSGFVANATESELTTLEGAFSAGQDAVNNVFEDED